MKKSKNSKFDCEFVLNEKLHKEFQIAYSQDKIFIVLIVWIILLLLLYLILREYNKVIFFSIFIIVYMLILNLIKLYTTNYQYKRMLLVNNGEIKNKIEINDDGITGTNKLGNKNSYSFNQIVGIIETKNLIILKLKYRLGIIISKNTLNTAPDELIEYLLSKCNNVKSVKKSQSTKNLIIILYTIFVVIFMLSIFLR